MSKQTKKKESKPSGIVEPKKPKKITVTRKMEIRVNEEEEGAKKAVWTKLRFWDDRCFRIANTIMQHLFIQRTTNELKYFNEEFKENNPEIFKQGKGFSPANRTYRVASETFNKGEDKIPSDIISNLNNVITANFTAKQKEYFTGKRSLDTYKKGMPMPFSSKNMSRISLTEDGKNYFFTLLGIDFCTRFGRDGSGNKEDFFERSIFPDPEKEGFFKLNSFAEDEEWGGRYKLCNSSLQVDGKKLFLLAVFQFESEKFDLNKDSVMEASLSVLTPIILHYKDKEYKIGTKEEFLHPRIAIQGALRRRQKASTFVRASGKGNRKHKLHGIENFHKWESNFVNNRHHEYACKVIDMCLESRCGKLALKYVHEIHPPEELRGIEKKKWFEENQPLLRNWTYYGFTEKFKYKCKMVGIELLVELKEAEAT